MHRLDVLRLITNSAWAKARARPVSHALVKRHAIHRPIHRPLLGGHVLNAREAAEGRNARVTGELPGVWQRRTDARVGTSLGGRVGLGHAAYRPPFAQERKPVRRET